MSQTRKRFAPARRTARRLLGAILPSRAHEAAHAWYIAKWWLPRVGDGGEPDLAVLRALLAAGDSAIDGGANFGRYADALAEAVAPAGRVLAVEPVPRSARLLRRVMKLRRRANVTVIEAALAEFPGTGRMEVPSDDRGESNFFRAHLSDHAGASSIEVRLHTIDEVADGLPSTPTLVKLDLEGHERAALRGAGKTMAAGAAWLVEMNDDPDDPGTDAAAIEADFRALGYEPWTYDQSSRSLLRRGTAPRGVNVFLLLPGHIARLERSGLTVRRGGAGAG